MFSNNTSRDIRVRLHLNLPARLSDSQREVEEVIKSKVTNLTFNNRAVQKES